MPLVSTRTPVELCDRMRIAPPVCAPLPSSRILPVSFVPSTCRLGPEATSPAIATHRPP